MEINKIYQMDCLEGLKKMENDSVDLVFTSPPYNMNLRVRNGKYCSRQIVKELTTKYNGFDDNLSMEDYFEFNKQVIEQCLRVSDIVFYNVQILTGNKRALFKLIGHFNEQLKEFIVWDKVNAQPAIRDKVLNSQFELILVFDKKNAIARRFDGAQFERGTLSNLWEIKRGKKINKNHGAVFPEELVEKVILNFSQKGDMILDPFMGTGTTAKIALENNRNYVGFEISEEYIEAAEERIANMQIKLEI